MSRLEGNKGSQSNLPQYKNKNKDKSIAVPLEQEQDKDSILQTWEEIEQIRKENKELRDEIKTEARMNNLNAPVLVTKMEQIQELSSIYAQKIEVETQKKKDLELLKQISQDTINSNLKKMSQSNGIALPQLQAKIKQLEYKLEKTRSRHNESLAQINMLKEQVNMARRERVIFSNVFKKLESDIKLKDEEFKKYMIEKMHVDIKKKQLEEELQKIKLRAKKEVLLFKNEYQQLFNQSKAQQQQQQQSNNESLEYNPGQKRIFETEVILNEQLNTANNTTIINNNSIISNNNNPNNMSATNNPNYIIPNNSTMTNQSSILNNKNINQKNQANSINLQVTQEELQKYQFMFQKIQKEVGIDDLDHLIYLFENIDKENNDLYESANSKSDEIDALKKKIKEVENEIQKYSKHNDNKQKLSSVKDKKQQDIQKYEKKIDNVDNLAKVVNTDIQSVNTKLIKIAEKFNIPIPQGEEIEETSFIKFLQDVEARINDIINMSLYCEGKIINIDRHHHETQATIVSLSKKGDNNSGIALVLDGVKKNSESESERILTKGDFDQVSKNEIKNFKENKGKVPLSQKGKKSKI
ncbi:hypothetical protein ABPG74_018698 [Tetrahymena malaccensis]